MKRFVLTTSLVVLMHSLTLGAEPQTPVVLSFENVPANSFFMHVTISANMTAQIGVPKGAGSALSLDGKVLKGVEPEGSLFIDNVGSGKHEILLQE